MRYCIQQALRSDMSCVQKVSIRQGLSRRRITQRVSPERACEVCELLLTQIELATGSRPYVDDESDTVFSFDYYSFDYDVHFRYSAVSGYMTIKRMVWFNE